MRKRKRKMNSEQLKAFLGEMVAFLQALDAVMPSKVDEELISWLESVEAQPWTCELLVQTLKKR